jgi:hypothetical protein
MHSERRPNWDRSPDPLEARLRALPRPPVSAGLEDRLLAAIPAELPIPQQRWAVRVGAVGAMAAACLAAVLAWPRGDAKNPVPSPGSREFVHQVHVPIPEKSEGAHQVPPRPQDGSTSLAAWPGVRRVLDGGEFLTFTWPLPETSPIRFSTAIPPDLLD